LKEKGITINAVNPGTVRTTIMLTNIKFTSDEVKNVTGNFYSKCKPVVVPKRFNNKDVRTKLLQYYETIFEKI
jgi:NAD(P)-dependent dehydrogenase (short-subunit alcohol dehydrogenase family)